LMTAHPGAPSFCQERSAIVTPPSVTTSAVISRTPSPRDDGGGHSLSRCRNGE